jgi:hypothetical protein
LERRGRRPKRNTACDARLEERRRRVRETGPLSVLTTGVPRFFLQLSDPAREPGAPCVRWHLRPVWARSARPRCRRPPDGVVACYPCPCTRSTGATPSSNASFADAVRRVPDSSPSSAVSCPTDGWHRSRSVSRPDRGSLGISAHGTPTSSGRTDLAEPGEEFCTLTLDNCDGRERLTGHFHVAPAPCARRLADALVMLTEFGPMLEGRDVASSQRITALRRKHRQVEDD